MDPRLIVCGSIAIDRLMRFGGRFSEIIKPEYIEELSISVLLDEQNDSYGGTGGNIAYNLALMGAEPLLLGSVGANSAEYMRFLGQLGVDVSQVHTSQRATASFNGMIDSDGNQIGGFYPGAMSDYGQLDIEKIATKDDLVVVSAHDPIGMRQQVEACRSAGLRLVYDASQQISTLPVADLRAGLDAAELVIMNQYESELLADRLGTTVGELRASVPILVVTKGQHGSVVSGTKLPKTLEIAIAEPAQTADASGAGDAYRAGFLCGYIRGWELAVCAQMGAVAGSFAVEHLGTQSHRFDKDAFRQRYQQAFKQEIEI